MYDLISLTHNGFIEPEVRVLDHGFVRLIDSMPRVSYNSALKSCDFAVVRAARTSVGLGIKTPKEDRNLLRYLMRHRHTSPFEQVEFQFHCAMPIFVARQWVRHRMASLNEFSGRYAELPDKFYIPTEDKVREQSNFNKQGGEKSVDSVVAIEFIRGLNASADSLYSRYKQNLEEGIAKELSRIGLPINLYTPKMSLWYTISSRC